MARGAGSSDALATNLWMSSSSRRRNLSKVLREVQPGVLACRLQAANPSPGTRQPAVGCLVSGLRPGGRPTFWRARKWAKSGPCSAAHPLRGWVPRVPKRLHALGPSLGVVQHAGVHSVLSQCIEARGRAELTALRSVQTGATSQFLKRAAHAPRAPALLGGSKGKAGTANSRNTKARSRSYDRLFALEINFNVQAQRRRNASAAAQG